MHDSLAAMAERTQRLRAIHLSLLSGSSQSLHLLTDGEGFWTTESGETIPLLKGCLDVDLSATPFTNTLPIADEKRFPGMTVLSIAPLLARAIQEVFEDGSVTSLFNGNA